jgi:hypothetical protein
MTASGNTAWADWEWGEIADFEAGLASMFDQVKDAFEAMHGPLNGFYTGSDDWPECPLTGRWLRDDKEHGRQPMCDGSRDCGGSFTRFFQAHHRLSRPLGAETPLGAAQAGILYGWALKELSDSEVIDPKLIDPRSLETAPTIKEGGK